MSEPQSPVLTVTELAREAGVSGSNIRQLLAKGTLLGHKLGDSIWVIPREEAERYLASRKGRRRASFCNRREV